MVSFLDAFVSEIMSNTEHSRDCGGRSDEFSDGSLRRLYDKRL